MALLLVEDEVRQLLSMEEAIEAVENAFRSLAMNQATSFPRQRNVRPGITLNVLCSISNQLDAAGIKAYPIVRQDVTVGSSFTILVYKVSTGGLIGILEANELGQIRTGAASGVACKYLARPDSRVMTLFGAGWQAESQVEAIACVIPSLERVNVVSRTAERAKRFCERMTNRIRPRLNPAGDPESAVKAADIVTTATGSRRPVFDGAWVAAGTFVNAIGSNFADKQEIDAKTVAKATCIVVDDLDVARTESGDLLAAEKEGCLEWQRVQCLADVVAGRFLGRTAESDITLFESHGIGLEDLAAACRVLKVAESVGMGQKIALQ